METNDYRPITLSKKRQLIDAAGFRFKPEFGLYVNKQLKKAFSWQFFDAHNEDDIDSCLREPANGRWQFYFNEPPPPGVRQQLEAEL